MAVIDDYLPCESYLGKDLDPKDNRITKFSENDRYYFALINPGNVVLLKSEGYTSAKGRDNGLAAVFKNILNESRYSVIKDGKVYRVILKAGNHQEIAKSCGFKSESEANANKLALVAFSTEKSGATASAPKTATAVAKATKKSATAETSAPVAAKAVESEPKKASKATKKDAAVTTEAKVSAKASPKSKNVEGIEINEKPSATVSENVESATLVGFLNQNEYLNRERIWDSYGMTGFVKFRHQNGLYYFGVYNPDGSLYLRSKGFEDDASRDNAFDLMESSILLEENYKVEQIDGEYYSILFEYNEILAISRGFGSFIDAFVTTPGGRPKDNVVGTMY